MKQLDKKRVIGGLAGLAVGALAVRQIRMEVEELREELELAEGVSFEVVTEDGARIDGIVCGEGPPVVLCHGLTETRAIWVPLATRLLERGYQVVAYDLRGHGKSTAGDAPPKLDVLAHDLRALFETLDLQDAILVGHSMGGMAAQIFAIDHAEYVADRLRAMILTSTGAARVAGPPMASAARMVYGNLRFERLLNSRIGLALTRPTAGKTIHRVHLAASRDAFTAMPAADRLAWLREIQEMDLREGLPRVRVPTTVVVGGRDLMTPPFLSRIIVKHLPDAQLIKVPGAGHQITYERPDLLVEVIVEAAEAATRGSKPELCGQPGAMRHG